MYIYSLLNSIRAAQIGMRTPVIRVDNDACGVRATPPKTLSVSNFVHVLCNRERERGRGGGTKLALIFKSNSSTLWQAIFK